MPTVDQVFDQQGLWKWYSSGVTNRYDGGSEKGEDFSTTFGTRVGAVAPGRVVQVIHNNNAINDIVIVQGTSGTWLYQHITAHVNIGDSVGVGTVVGTENGMPPDKYSTGPHIEVRWLPPGMWQAGVDQWNQRWLNPAGVFAKVGASNAAQVGPFNLSGGDPNSSSGSGVSPGAAWVDQLRGEGIKIGLFVLALVLVGFGFYMLFTKQINQAAKKGIEVAKVAAVA